MIRKELEQRLPLLERSLDQFYGMDWIIHVGTLSELKLAVLTMTPEIETSCLNNNNVAYHDVTTMAELDDWIAASRNGAPADRLSAFVTACAMIKRVIAPALPGSALHESVVKV